MMYGVARCTQQRSTLSSPVAQRGTKKATSKKLIEYCHREQHDNNIIQSCLLSTCQVRRINNTGSIVKAWQATRLSWVCYHTRCCLALLVGTRSCLAMLCYCDAPISDTWHAPLSCREKWRLEQEPCIADSRQLYTYINKPYWPQTRVRPMSRVPSTTGSIHT